MSVYRVISNYYNDLLNFLNDEDTTFKGLPNMFRDITADKKKFIILKLSDMMVRFDMAFKNEINYWNSQRKNQMWFLIIYIIMIVIIFIIIVIIFYIRIKELKEKHGTNIFMICKSVINYIIIYQIILILFILLIINIISTKKLCNGQINLLKDDIKHYSGYIFEGANRSQLYKFFTFMGYWVKNSKFRYISFYKELKNDSSYDNVLSSFNITTNTKNIQKPVEEDLGNNNIGKEVEIYDKLRQDIEQSLIKFYNGGKGYIDVKKMILLANPILILKEAKYIMNYYYFIAYKKISNETPSIDNDTKTKEIIDNIVINPINNLIKDFDTSNYEINDSELAKIIYLNNQDTNFKDNMEKLIDAFDYLAIFAYPIYIKMSDKDITFPLPGILPYMPNMININNESANTKIFLEGLRNVFNTIYNNEYQTYIINAQSLDDVTPLLNDLFMKFIPLYTELYYNVFTYLQGGYWFPFNQKFIVNKIQLNLNMGITSVLPVEYRTFVSQIMFNTIITNIGQNFDILKVKKVFLIETISNNLLPSKINMIQYQNYIINTLLKKNTIIQKYVEEIVELINQIQKSISIKKQFRVSLIDNIKFIEPDEFIDIIKNIKYNEFIEKLNVDFYQDIIDKFYANISESVNLKTPNLRNIYYQRQKNFKIWKITIVMMIITIILILIRFIMNHAEDKKTIIYNKPKTDCNELFTKRDFINRNSNWYIKLVLPIFFVLFIVSMLISFHKKMQYTFEFNLEIIENNTNELKKLLDEFNKKLADIDINIDNSDKTKNIEMITKLSDDDKKNIFEYIKKIIDKFEKCNYIIESSKNQIPFPYTEVIMYGFIFLLTILCIFYVIFAFTPMAKLKDIKYLNKLKEELFISDDINSFNIRLESLGSCHDEDMTSILLALKLIVFVFILLFLIFYSVKIITSANDFKFGLYNSAFFEESRCYDNN